MNIGVSNQKKFIAMNASNKLDKVLIGTYLEMYDKIPDDYFDLVICNDVIEHMIDTDIFFQTIKKKLKKDAYLIASIPNVRYMLNLFELLVQKDWEYKDAGIFDNTQRRFFTKKVLNELSMRMDTLSKNLEELILPKVVQF